MKAITKKMKASAGFTLLEILVVLTIMGFLIAMVAPRLAGISGSAVDTVCDGNQDRQTTMMSAYFERTAKFPDKMTNLVDQIGDGDFQIPAVSDQVLDNGPETLAEEFNDRNHFRIHFLNKHEVKELRDMGIVTVFNLNAYDAYNEDGSALKSGYLNDDANDEAQAETVTKYPSMQQVNLSREDDPKIAVAMIGMGAEGHEADLTMAADLTERGWADGDFIGRIILGFGPENGLITSGLVSGAAHCPGGIQNQENVTYNDYNLVLPRLASTVDRLTAEGATSPITDFDDTTPGIQFRGISYTEDTEPGDDYNLENNDDNYKYRVFTLNAQEPWQYATMCPEGHQFPEDDDEFWGLDFNNNAQVN